MIYEEKPVQSSLVDDPSLYQRIIDALPLPIFYRDRNGIYQTCNTAHEKLIRHHTEQSDGEELLTSSEIARDLCTPRQ